MRLAEAIKCFREITEQTVSGSVATALGGATTTRHIPRRTEKGRPFFGIRGLGAIERERQERMRRAKKAKKKCKGYDPECRDKEWEVRAPIGGVAMLRRSRLGD